jgi:hypothetical protein
MGTSIYGAGGSTGNLTSVFFQNRRESFEQARALRTGCVEKLRPTIDNRHLKRRWEIHLAFLLIEPRPVPLLLSSGFTPFLSRDTSVRNIRQGKCTHPD